MPAASRGAARSAQALDLAAARRRRQLDALRGELARCREACERALARCADKQRDLDAAQRVEQAQRVRLERLRAGAFSCEAWLDGVQMLELLGERRAEQARALERLQTTRAAADTHLLATRGRLAAAQARIDLLQAQAARLRAVLAAARAERDEEAAAEDAQARRRAESAA